MTEIVIGIIILVTATCFANDTFTLEETKLINKQINSAINKKFTPQYLKQIEKNAASKYLLFKVGDKFTANSGGRHFTGTIRNINKLTVRVGDFLINMRDYPDYYFDIITNDRWRKAYVSKYYHHAKNSYRQRAAKYYKKKIVEVRPTIVEAPAIEQPAEVTVETQPNKTNKPRIKNPVMELFKTCEGVWKEIDINPAYLKLSISAKGGVLELRATNGEVAFMHMSDIKLIESKIVKGNKVYVFTVKIALRPKRWTISVLPKKRILSVESDLIIKGKTLIGVYNYHKSIVDDMVDNVEANREQNINNFWKDRKLP